MSDESQSAELLRRGIAAAKAGRKEEAHEILLQVVKLDERNEQAWLWLSAVVDSNEEREICLENVLAINPENARARAGLDWLRQSSPQAEASVPEPELTPEADRCPRCGAAVRASSSACPQCDLPLIVACPACGDYAGVEEATCPRCGQALGDFRQGSAYHLGLARLYLQHHVTERAQDSLARAEAEARGDAAVLAQVGALYEEAGFRSQAIATYKRALEVAPRDPALYARLAAVYRQHGEPATAMALYEKAEELGSQDPTVHYELAQLEMETGEAQKAVARLQPLLRKQPVDPRAILLTGDALQRLGDRDAAVAYYRRAVQSAPVDTDAGREARSKLAQLGAAPGRDARAARRRQAPGRRPGCVTIYALLTIVSALLSVLGALALAALFAGGRLEFQRALAEQGMGGLIDLDRLVPYVGLGLGISLLSGVINLAIGIGLWMLKNWARIAVIVLSTLGLIGGLVQVALTTGAFRAAAGSGSGSLPAPLIAGLVGGFAVQALVIFWFLVNRDVFD